MVVSGQLLQLLSNSQRPRSATSSAGVDKKKQGPLSFKFHDISLKDWTGSGKSKPKVEPIADVATLQTETGVGTLDTAVKNIQIECASEDVMLANADASDIFAVNTTSADTFCPKITSIVSLENIQ